ncbi:hypothetical protein C0991_000208 [Blastosporella zonata]|nr:hypothetical protein C0991_000208 [Blastosporella zonata]
MPLLPDLRRVVTGHDQHGKAIVESDRNLASEGELILITEDGTETHLKNPGDTVVQKGTMHAWRNPSDNWTRWVTVLIAAEPAIVDGEPLAPAFLPSAT